MTMYEILCQAHAIYLEIQADYPNATEDDEVGHAQDCDPRWDTWNDMMHSAEQMLPDPDDFDILCGFDPKVTSEGDLKRIIAEAYPLRAQALGVR